MKIDCPRCDAKGILPQFMHIDNGICFLCLGNKQINQGNLDKCKSVAYSVWYYWKNFDRPGEDPIYRVRAGWHQLDGKGGQTCIFHYQHTKYMTEPQAVKLVERVKAANLDIKHFETSPYWTNPKQQEKESAEFNLKWRLFKMQRSI